MKSKDYHCCATCRHFRITRSDNGVKSHCNRLGYDTKSNYRFHCWDPRTDILEKMREQSSASNKRDEGLEANR